MDVAASRLARASGYYSYGAYAGAFYLDVNSSTSSASAYIGSRLMFL